MSIFQYKWINIINFSHCFNCFRFFQLKLARHYVFFSPSLFHFFMLERWYAWISAIDDLLAVAATIVTYDIRIVAITLRMHAWKLCVYTSCMCVTCKQIFFMEMCSDWKMVQFFFFSSTTINSFTQTWLPLIFLLLLFILFFFFCFFV